MSKGKIAVVVVAILVALAGLGLIAGGTVLLVFGAQDTEDGFITSPSAALSTDSHALTSAEIDLGSIPADWYPSGRLATVRFQVDPQDDAPVFVGIGPSGEVDDYLDGVAHSVVTRIGPNVDDVAYRTVPGETTPAMPSEEGFWADSVEGVGEQTLTWEVERGEWSLVIMNADGSPGVSVATAVGVMTELLIPIAVALLAAGLILAAIATTLLVVGLRQPVGAAPAVPVTAAARGFGNYPVILEGDLDPDVSRWQWLFKWLLVIPHFVVLAFLWAAFVLLTVVAWFAILFTGRYPRSIFDFNVGVLRWSWRVGYYSYGALGTDRYPPFAFESTEYPARLEIAYPEHLSRGLVLVKWWLLAIPHYLIVGLFTSGLVWTTTQLSETGDPILRIGGGLIGLLVVIAGVILLFSGRYPQGLFDLIMGLNRWVFRVAAYATLMRDEYPPFRLDTGGTEPNVSLPGPPPAPAGGEEAGNHADPGSDASPR